MQTIAPLTTGLLQWAKTSKNFEYLWGPPVYQLRPWARICRRQWHLCSTASWMFLRTGAEIQVDSTRVAPAAMPTISLFLRESVDTSTVAKAGYSAHPPVTDTVITVQSLSALRKHVIEIRTYHAVLKVEKPLDCEESPCSVCGCIHRDDKLFKKYHSYNFGVTQYLTTFEKKTA